MRKWAAISCVAAAMERKVWVKTLGESLFPNLFTILVGPAAAGKSVLTSRVHGFFRSIGAGNPSGSPVIAKTSVTRASLIDELVDAERVITRPQDVPPVKRFNALYVCVNELGVFMPEWDMDFIEILTDLWDCRDYSERRRGSLRKEPINIPNLSFNLLSATTPMKLKMLLPEGAWETGFMSRTVMVYGSDSRPVDIFDEPKVNVKLKLDLEKDLKSIAAMWGQMSFTVEAVAAFREWMKAGEGPKPDHPRLITYCDRRRTNVLKLCMVASAVESSNLIIDVRHFDQALDWLIEAEENLHEVFKSMAAGADSNIIKDTWHYIFMSYQRRGQKPMSEQQLITFLSDRCDAMRIPTIIMTMEKMGLLRKEYAKGSTIFQYVPVKPERGT